MKAYTKIGLKNSFVGLFNSALAATVVVFAIRCYAGPVPPVLYPCAAAFAVFVVMNRALWQGVKQSYDAGEVGRRMTQLNAAHLEGRGDVRQSAWFAQESTFSNGPKGHSHKKTLPVLAPEGSV